MNEKSRESEGWNSDTVGGGTRAILLPEVAPRDPGGNYVEQIRDTIREREKRKRK
jgi:hypothetical protein